MTKRSQHIINIILTPGTPLIPTWSLEPCSAGEPTWQMIFLALLVRLDIQLWQHGRLFVCLEWKIVQKTTWQMISQHQHCQSIYQLLQHREFLTMSSEFLHPSFVECKREKSRKKYTSELIHPRLVTRKPANHASSILSPQVSILNVICD